VQISTKRLIGVIAGVSVFASAPAVMGYDRGGSGHERDSGRHGGDLDVIGLTQDARLIRFEDDRPGKARDVGRVKGLVGDTKLVGIDYRPASGNDGSRGVLYGLGDAGGVYTVDRGRSTKVSQLSIPLEGSSFGVDFNPVVDRLRIISDTGQNLRHNVDAPTGGTLQDAPLTYTAPTAAAGVTGAAYTNNDQDPNTATTLFDIDSTMDQTSIQSPANAGTLAATGKLGVDTGPVVGSDIYSTVRDGSTVRLRGLASLTVGGQSRLYRIDLLKGRANSRGSFAARNQVTAIAIPLNQL